MPLPDELWPFRPLVDRSRERLEWRTDLLDGFTGEQRIASRSAPRQVFEHAYRLQPRQYALAKALAARIAYGEVAVPVWIEAVQVAAVGAADTVLSFDTTAGDWRAGGGLVVWQDEETFAMAEIDTVSAGSVTLTAPVGADFTRPVVAPVRRAIAIEPFETSRYNRIGETTATFLVTDNEDLAGAALATQYLGLDVLTEPPVRVGDIAERIVAAAEFIDNGTGPVAVEPTRVYVTAGFTLGFAEETAAGLWARRGWLHRLKGRQKPFWLPSFMMDLELTEPIGALASFVTVRSLGAASAYEDRHVMLELEDGTRFFRQVTSVTLGGATDQIAFDTIIGQAVAIAEVRRFSFLARARLDADRVTISYRAPAAATITVPVLEVPA